MHCVPLHSFPTKSHCIGVSFRATVRDCTDNSVLHSTDCTDKSELHSSDCTDNSMLHSSALTANGIRRMHTCLVAVNTVSLPPKPIPIAFSSHPSEMF